MRISSQALATELVRLLGEPLTAGVVVGLAGILVSLVLVNGVPVRGPLARLAARFRSDVDSVGGRSTC